MSFHRQTVQQRASALLGGVAVMMSAVVMEASPAAASPAGAGCRGVRPTADFYEAGRVASELLTVPTSSRCTTISVKNIKDPRNPSDHCATFLLGFFPAEGEFEYTEPVEACSGGSGGREIVLATDVPDGMPYRVLYQIDYLGQSLRYVIKH